jgi:hypothetical protein
MNIARPVTGFLIEEPASFAVYIANLANKWPRLAAHWDSIKDRLKMTAHKDGQAVGHNPLHRVFETLGSKTAQLPTVRVAYFVFADTLTFIAILVFDPAD